MRREENTKDKIAHFFTHIILFNYNQIAIALKLGYNCSHITLQ